MKPILPLSPCWAAMLVMLTTATPAAAQIPDTYSVVNGTIPHPLTTSPGNPERGRQILRDQGHVTCLICHTLPIPGEPDHGNVGPSLLGVGTRYSAGELRLRLVDPKAINPNTMMPSYFRSTGLHRVQEQYRNQTIYTPQQVEDVVSYLSSLKDRQP